MDTGCTECDLGRLTGANYCHKCGADLRHKTIVESWQGFSVSSQRLVAWADEKLAEQAKETKYD